ncbi:MAG: aspartate aminotransferase family protein [Actinomycetota bacterium]
MAEWLARHAAVVAPVLPSYFDVVADRAEGSWVWDVDGRRYLDFGSGIGVTNTGHRHPHVVAAIHAQVDKLLHTSVVLKHQPYIEAAEAVAGLAPYMSAPKVFFCNSGAEAVDGAIKLARRTTGRPGVIAFRRGFHGRTLAATSLTTAKSSYREGYDPLLPDVHIAPYCIPGVTAPHATPAGAAEAALAELDLMLKREVAPKSVAAMIVEPVLGEGGYVVPPVAWLSGLRQRCDELGILLVFDEVQTGFGRTGRPFAAEAMGVVPDVILFAKGVASGLPLAGIMAPAELMDRWPQGTHGSTFGGNPVACAAAVATVEVLDRDHCYDRAIEIGARAMARLRALPTSAIVEVRGIGAMVGVELRDRATAEQVQARCLADGVIVLTCGPEGNVLRLIPPLTITDEELDFGMDRLALALAS